MAVLNADRPFGAIPVGTFSGASWEGALRRCRADGSTAIFRGDKVVHATGGVQGGFTVKVDNNATAVTDGALLGLMVAPVVDRSLAVTEHPGYVPASGTPDCLIVMAPDLIFLSQEDNVGDPIAFTDLGNITISPTTVTGSTVTGIAGWELDSSTSTAVTDGPIRLLQLYDAPDNLQGDDSGAPGGGGVTADNRPKWLCTWQNLALYHRSVETSDL